MKCSELFESMDADSIIKMMTQGIRNVNLDIKELNNVKFKKQSGSQKKQCFNNSFKAMTGHPNSKYVLGYVMYKGIPIEHAWIKEGEQYFDVTLDPKQQDGYVSVYESDFDSISEYVDKYQSAPSLYDLNRFFGKK